MFIDRGMDKDVVHIYNGILLSHKKNKIMPFSATWMDLRIIILSELSEKRQIPSDFIHMWNLIFFNDTNELIYRTETNLKILKTNL